MITRIKGKIVSKYPLEVETTSGVTYGVTMSDRNLSLINEEDTAEILIYHYIREDSWQLYGFLSLEEKLYFNEMIKVSGIGPKIAMSILSVYTPDEIKELVMQRDFVLLSKVPGLGKKGAQKIILELSSKIDDGDFGHMVSGRSSDDNPLLKELKMALKNLGFTGEELEQKMKTANELINEKSDIKIEQLVEMVMKR